jgi:hypothetical protein
MAPLDDPSLSVKPYVWHELRSRDIRGVVCSRHEQTVSLSHDRFGDARDLVGRLALAEDDLGKAGAGGALVVDARKAEVFDARRLEEFAGAVLGGVSVEAAVADGDEQAA